MKAMILNRICDLNKEREPLKLVELPEPVPGEREILIKVTACGVCHTELDEIEGRTPPPEYPVIPGHQVIGRIVKKGKNADRFNIDDRVGVAWIFSACGTCNFCNSGNENLCQKFQATGRDADGGYAHYMKVLDNFAFKIPDSFSDS